MTNKIILKRAGKVVLYILLFVLVLLVAAFIFINTSYGKKIVRNQVQSILEKKLQTKVLIGSVDYSLPKWIRLNGVYMEDQHKDTLLYGKRLSVDLNMLKLLRGNIYIRKVELDNIRANVSRTSTDTVFNYQFILDAFAGKQKNTVRDTAALELTLKRLVLHDVVLKFNDAYEGNQFTTSIQNLDATLTKFKPDRFQFDIDKFNADSVDFMMVSNKKNTTAIIMKDSVSGITYPLIINAAS